MRYILTSLVFCLAGIAACAEPGPAAPTFNAEASGVVLMYHHVDASTPPITSIQPDRFIEQLDYLASSAFDVWPLDRLVDHVRTGKATPPNTVAITFDDAYISIYTTAFPELRKRGFPFTIFVATEFVGTNPHYLTWDQLREMHDAGAIIANHTHTHTHLLRAGQGESTRAWRARIKADIEQANELIEANIGSSPPLFAYPYGEYNPEVIEVVKELGFTAFGQQSGAMGMNDSPQALPRFPMGGPYTAMDPFKTKVATLPLPIATINVNPVLIDDFRPRLVLDFLDDNFRFGQLTCYGPGGDTMPLVRESRTRFVTQSIADVPVGRSRYNCTMPTTDGSRYYWFSQMWIRKRDDGSWYPEP